MPILDHLVPTPWGHAIRQMYSLAIAFHIFVFGDVERGEDSRLYGRFRGFGANLC
jgi:hypothetical protein